MLSDPSKIWWDEITGPSKLVRSLANSIQAAKSVVLHVPDDLPWRQQMRLSVERVLRNTDSELLIWYIDCENDCRPFIKSDGTMDVAGYLLQERAVPEVRSGYRVASGKTIQQYMIENGVLQDRVVWIKGLDRKKAQSWLDFCKGYTGHSQYDGVFVIESYDGLNVSGSDNMVSVKYLDFVSRYDALLFNNMVVADLLLKEEWKSYIAAVSTMVCNLDVELADAFISSTDFGTTDIVESLIAVSKSPRFANRLSASRLDNNHPFVLLRNGKVAEIKKHIWKAQLQVLYPLLEIERVSFIDRYKSDIRTGFTLEYYDRSEKKRRIDQFGVELEDPYEAEIGTLYRMNKLCVAGEYGRHILPISVESDRCRLILIHDIRNLLAHVTICSVEQVNQFLSGYPFCW